MHISDSKCEQAIVVSINNSYPWVVSASRQGFTGLEPAVQLEAVLEEKHAPSIFLNYERCPNLECQGLAKDRLLHYAETCWGVSE